jgi:ubiquitin-activating enzyme E1
VAAANLHAFNYGLRGETDPNVFTKVADSVLVTEFIPKSGVKIQVNENEPVTNEGDAGKSLCKSIRAITTNVSWS